MKGALPTMMQRPKDSSWKVLTASVGLVGLVGPDLARVTPAVPTVTSPPHPSALW